MPGLWHSWRNNIEYNDYSTSMGRGDACPNAAEISRMGWASPAGNGGGAINATALPAGGTRTFHLPATYLTGTGNYLRIRPTWLANYGDVLQSKNLYIAVRVAKVGDAALSSTYASKVNVHEVNAIMVRVAVHAPRAVFVWRTNQVSCRIPSRQQLPDPASARCPVFTGLQHLNCCPARTAAATPTGHCACVPALRLTCSRSPSGRLVCSVRPLPRPLPASFPLLLPTHRTTTPTPGPTPTAGSPTLLASAR
jgi:hypothetical protein